MGKFNIADFQAEVAFTMQKPFLRVKGVEFETDQTIRNMLNKSGPENGKIILNAVTYEVQNELMDDVISKMKKGNKDQLVNNFWQAKIPHDNMFLAWDAAGPDELNKFAGVHIEKVSSERVVIFDFKKSKDSLRDGSQNMPEEFFMYRFFRGFEEEGKERLKILHSPISIMNAAYTEFDRKPTYTRKYEDLEIPAPWSYYENDLQAAKKLNMPDAHFPYSAFDLVKITTLLNNQPNFGTGLEYESWQGAFHFYNENGMIELDTSSRWEEMLAQLTVTSSHWARQDVNYSCSDWYSEAFNIPHEFLSKDPYQYSNEEIKRFQNTRRETEYEFSGILTPTFAVLAMNNFDWIVKDPVARKGKVKNLSHRLQPRNRHYTLEIKLPKEKQLIEGVQPDRTRKFGTALHEVQGHNRHYRDDHGVVYKTIWVKPHERGDKKFGIVTKDYVLTKDKKEND